ncbi:general glycosylation pathway protein [Aquisalimonas sp. 2447]|uniref:general glycosylation pathway protein n=1 Tax=Aquisalimonas sp. 2447 TaxID=2740807 RepID=UPI001580BA8B|nr:general glycosylation pathway protein [Aquisalimonas sp. 2447]
MNKTQGISDWIGRAVYGLISLSLGIISLTMMGVALWDIWLSIHGDTLLVTALLNAIGLIVIGMAVFDVSKFLLEEEVFSSSATKSPAKQRATLLKFLVIIAIAVNLEALVFVFDAGTKDITTLIYPTFLLIAAIFVVVGLGVYQKLTRDDDK